MPSIHGHEVLHLIIDQEPAVDAMDGILAQTFGADARFHTCSASDMNAAEMLQFLQHRGKIAIQDGRITADPSKMCGHDDGHHHHH